MGSDKMRLRCGGQWDGVGNGVLRDGDEDGGEGKREGYLLEEGVVGLREKGRKWIRG